jgi:hypothetical protein
LTRSDPRIAGPLPPDLYDALGYALVLAELADTIIDVLQRAEASPADVAYALPLIENIRLCIEEQSSEAFAAIRKVTGILNAVARPFEHEHILSPNAHQAAWGWASDVVRSLNDARRQGFSEDLATLAAFCLDTLGRDRPPRGEAIAIEAMREAARAARQGGAVWTARSQQESEDTPQKIPLDRRTRPLGLAEAARLMGYEKGRKAGAVLRRAMDAGAVAYEQLTRQSFIFDRNDFPPEAQRQLGPMD